MIIDGHAHIFESILGLNRDGVTTSGEYGRFRAGTMERAFMPAAFKKVTFDSEMLLASMDEAGIDFAVLLQNPTIGERNQEIQSSVLRSGGRLAGTILIDPFDGYEPGAVLNQWSSPLVQSCKIEMSETWGLSGIHPDASWRSAEMGAVFRAVADRGLKLILDPGPMTERGYDVEGLEALFEEYDSVPVLLEHFGYPSPETSTDATQKKLWRSMVSLARMQNVYLGLSALPELLMDDYPCETSLSLIKEVLDIVGEQKIIWGSDIPSTLRRMTYRQMYSYILGSDLPNSVVSRILGGNALEFFPELSESRGIL